MVQRSVRITLKERPSPIQLKVLRELFPQLRQVSPATLRVRLATSLSVVCHSDAEQIDALQRRAEETNIGLEFFDESDYTADYVRRTLPAPPPTWAHAENSIEAVFRPSFSPELIIRVWADKSKAHLQLASSNASMWCRMSSPPEWLLAAASEQSRQSAEQALDAEPLLPIEETVEVVPVDALFSLGRTLTQPEATLGADGMMVAVEIRNGSGVRTIETWSPTHESAPDVFALLKELHTLAWETCTRPESRRRLEELHTSMSLGLPFTTVLSKPALTRLWGILSVYEEAELRELLRAMSIDGGVVDLSDVDHVATIFSESFLEGGSSVHFVSPPRQPDLLADAGVPPSNVHTTRRDAVAACQHRP